MGITRLLLRVFGDPNWPSENVSATSIVQRNMSTRFHRIARISPIRSPVSTATATTVRQGSESSGALVAMLWLLACFLVIRSKERSSLWLFFAALGPFGFAILAMLNERAPAETDRHARFVRSLNRFARVGYEVCAFVVIWLLAYQAMVLKRNLMIMYQSATTGISTSQIIATQNASSGMWAFAEGIEVMFMVVLFYLLRPIVFNIVDRVAATMASPKPR
jgi:hypothetical protein